MIPSSARPKLAAKVRLRFDRHSNSHWLIYPERGLTLNASGARIAQLCSGEHSLAQIIAQLQTENSDVAPSQLVQDVQQFLEALLARKLIHID
jgi:pyrroloquinoline quinone biosynthesis protein D